MSMHSNLVKSWENLRSSYWFIPACMALSAVVLAFFLTTLDTRIGAAWLLDRVDWLSANQPDGARTLLSTIAGSMITVAGVTFSITIAAVAFASAQFGPRILTNFMEDRGNQITLGTFIATFLYCLLVLRTVHSAGDTSNGEQAAAEFVPHLAMIGAVVLALVSVGVLIYFIHHVPESIHVSNVVAKIGRGLEAPAITLYPGGVGDEHDADAGKHHEGLPEGFHEEATSIAARRAGYVHNLDGDGLFNLACRHDLTVQIVSRPGVFVANGQTTLLAWPSTRLDDAARDALANTFAIGIRRTAVQDLLFLVDELVEIAARALSPGVNDPFTAMTCIDWLRAGLVAFATRSTPDTHRFDKENALRVVASPIRFDDYADAFFDRMLPYVSADSNAALYLMNAIVMLIGQVDDVENRANLANRADELMSACRTSLPIQSSLEDIEQCYREVRRVSQRRTDPLSTAAVAPGTDSSRGTR